MTQENKELLLKDLCARAPYNVKCKVHLDTKGYCLRDEDKYCDDTLESVNCKKQTCTFNKSIGYNFGNFAIEEVKPYLRPMSSMTEKEREQLYSAIDFYGKIDKDGDIDASHHEFVFSETCMDYIDWLNAHHFDYRGLIKKGLALEAPKDMYKGL